MGSRARLGVWPPTACSNLQVGYSFSLFPSPFFDCVYELIIPPPPSLCSSPFLPTHTPLRHLVLTPRLLLASHLLTHLSPERGAHEEFMECPQEALPRSRPHSSFNTGRKIKKNTSQGFGEGREAGCVKTTHPFPV